MLSFQFLKPWNNWIGNDHVVCRAKELLKHESSFLMLFGSPRTDIRVMRASIATWPALNLKWNRSLFSAARESFQVLQSGWCACFSAPVIYICIKQLYFLKRHCSLLLLLARCSLERSSARCFALLINTKHAYKTSDGRLCTAYKCDIYCTLLPLACNGFEVPKCVGLECGARRLGAFVDG